MQTHCNHVDLLADDILIDMSNLDNVYSETFVTISGMCRQKIFIKIEGLNLSGSIKAKSAERMIADLEINNRITPSITLIESSSGNLGIALSQICARKGYKFICVTDPNTSDRSISMMRAMGATVHVVRQLDKNGGYLGTRIDYIRSLTAKNNDFIWINQYENDGNWRAHYELTGPEILRRIPNLDFLFIGAGTTGTLMGCARFFRENSPFTKIIGVDTAGSVTFGNDAGPRYIPGLGSSRKPPIFDPLLIDELVHVRESETVGMCHRLARKGLFAGGSTGTVLSGIAQVSNHIPSDAVIATISPDLGEKYLDSIYNDSWVESKWEIN